MCNKRGYPSESIARMCLVSLQSSSRYGLNNRKEKRVYFCYKCKEWHLTSKIKS